MSLRLVSLMLALQFAAAAGYAQHPSDAASMEVRTKLARELLTAWELPNFIDALKQGLISQDPGAGCFCEIAEEDEDKISSAWRSSVEANFNTHEVSEHVAASLAKHQSASALKRTLEFATSPLGRKLTKAALNTPKSTIKQTANAEVVGEFALLTKGMESLKRNPRRAKVIKDLIRVTEAVEWQTEIMMSVWNGTMAGRASLPRKNGPRLPEDAIDEVVGSQRMQIAELFASIMPATFAQTYSEISTKELVHYVTWLRTPDAKAITTALNSALARGLNVTAIKIGADFGKHIDASDI